jgi:hypothetical protein
MGLSSLWGAAEEGVRTDRETELDDLMRRHRVPPETFFASANTESMWLFLDSLRCYAAAIDSAALICAHAACERELAAALSAQTPPAGSERWGLGPLIQVGAKRGWFDDGLKEQLKRINENRRVFYHHQGEPLHTVLWQGAVAAASIPHKDAVMAAFPQQLRAAALDALDGILNVRAISLGDQPPTVT